LTKESQNNWLLFYGSSFLPHVLISQTKITDRHSSHAHLFLFFKEKGKERNQALPQKLPLISIQTIQSQTTCSSLQQAHPYDDC